MSYGHLQARFAKSCTEAAFGYARAATAAYVDLAGQSLDLWARAAHAATQAPGDRPHYQPDFDRSPSPMTPFDFWLSASNDWAKAMGRMTPFGDRGSPLPVNPMTVWWSLMPANALPASWPMAYAYMSSGVPRTVAWPAAEANAAVIDAAETAAETVTMAFSSYRSESGYAMSQLAFPRQLQAALLFAAPLSAALAFPWVLARA